MHVETDMYMFGVLFACVLSCLGFEKDLLHNSLECVCVGRSLLKDRLHNLE
jgi:uncharacterized membrane protein